MDGWKAGCCLTSLPLFNNLEWDWGPYLTVCRGSGTVQKVLKTILFVTHNQQIKQQSDCVRPNKQRGLGFVQIKMDGTCPLPPFEQRCSSLFGIMLVMGNCSVFFLSASHANKRSAMPASSAVVWTGFTKTSGIECVGGQIKHACSNCGGGIVWRCWESAKKAI